MFPNHFYKASDIPDAKQTTAAAAVVTGPVAAKNSSKFNFSHIQISPFLLVSYHTAYSTNTGTCKSAKPTPLPSATIIAVFLAFYNLLYHRSTKYTVDKKWTLLFPPPV